MHSVQSITLYPVLIFVPEEEEFLSPYYCSIDLYLSLFSGFPVSIGKNV